MTDRKLTTQRMTADARELRKKLSKKLGVSMSAVMELALRRLAEQEGIQLEQNKKLESQRGPQTS